MKYFFMISCMWLFYTTAQIDFGKTKDGNDWIIINDGVMGGLSEGEIFFNENSVSFSGNISLRNNGGFSAFRSPFQRIDLSAYQTVEMKVRGTGQEFAITFENNRYWFIPYFRKKIPLKGEDWQTISLNLSSFEEYRIGRPTGNLMSEQQKARLIRMGVINVSKKSGPFTLEIDYIKFK